jgi:hypothetical protein
LLPTSVGLPGRSESFADAKNFPATTKEYGNTGAFSPGALERARYRSEILIFASGAT